MSDKRLRILFVVGQLGGGGQEFQLYMYLKHIDMTAYKPVVAVLWLKEDDVYKKKIEELNIPIIPLDRSKNKVFQLFQLRSIVKKYKPDIVQSYSFHSNFPSWFSMLGCKGVTLGAIRNDYNITRRSGGILRGIINSRFPADMIANSRNAYDQMLEHKGLLAPKGKYFVPNGLEIPEEIQENSIQEKINILGIGRLTKIKRWDVTLEALAIFSKKYENDWFFRLCGAGEDELKLKSLAKKLGIDEHVEFMGFRKDISEQIKLSNVVVLNSEFEGTPNAILESLAQARPVIVTAVGDLINMIEDNVNGIITPLNNPKILADKLLFLAENFDEAKKIGSRGYKYVKANYSIEALKDRYNTIYQDLL